MIDLKAIRAAAEAAPKDILHVRHDFGVYFSLRQFPGDYYQGRVRGKERANFIATANPAAILELLDRLEAAEKDAARLDWILAYFVSNDTSKDAEIIAASVGVDQLKTVIDAAMGEQK